MKNPPSKLRQQLSQIIAKFVTKFEKKHDCYLDYTVSDDDLGVFIFGDNAFNLSDIIEDIENDYPQNAIFEWQNHITEYNLAHEKEMRLINLKSYIMGARLGM